MINHSGQFERVGGKGHFLPSLAEAAQAVKVDVSRLPSGRQGSHYIPASAIGGSGRNDAGRVSYHGDGRGGRVFNFKTSMMAVWREDAGQRLSAVEKRRLQYEREAAEAKEAEDKKARAVYGHYTAELILQASARVDEHPYLTRKRVRPVGPMYEADIAVANAVLAERGYRTEWGFQRIGYRDDDGWHAMTGRVLVVPMWNNGQLGTLEFIDAAGHKSFLPKAPTAGAWWSTRLIGDAPVIGIAEGVATALSIDLVRGIPCVAAMSCGNMPQIAGWFARHCPGREFRVFSDKGNGEEDARKAAGLCGGILELPSFSGELLAACRERTGTDKAPTDWNDYYIATGELP